MFVAVIRAAASAAIIAIGLTACSGALRPAEIAQDPQQEVKELATARWSALVAGDLTKAYEYLSPGMREAMSLDAYKKKTRTGGWKNVRVDTVTCEADRCNVSVMVEFSYRDLKALETRLEEIWLKDGGRWWLVPAK